MIYALTGLGMEQTIFHCKRLYKDGTVLRKGNKARKYKRIYTTVLTEVTQSIDSRNAFLILSGSKPESIDSIQLPC